MNFFKARLFGKKIIGVEPATKTDKGCIVTARWYKDVMYVMKVEYFD